jgi:hypothetical protein
MSAVASRLLFEISEQVANRRDDPRIEAREGVRVYAVNSSTFCDATVRNVSSRGLSLETTQAFTAGSTLVIEWDSGYLPGIVRHCRPAESRWMIGFEVELLPGSRALLAALKKSAHERNRLLLMHPKGI